MTHTLLKVVMIFDQAYASKSDNRSGGAGIEAQIITPELYSKRAQGKVVAVVRERDSEGNAFIPTYYKGRIFIDLCDSATYSEEFEKLVRLAWDRPAFVKPKLGDKPSYLREDSSSFNISTSSQFRRAVDAIKNDRIVATQATDEYFDTLLSGLRKFYITSSEDEFHEQLIGNIEAFLPYKNQIIEIIITIVSYRDDVGILKVIHRFLEKLLSLTYMPIDAVQRGPDSVDNFRFLAYELFLSLIAVCLKYERFSAAKYFIETEYYAIDRLDNDTVMHPNTAFCQVNRTILFRVPDRGSGNPTPLGGWMAALPV